MQNAQEATAAVAAAAVVREATAAAVMDVLEGESEEERATKLAAAKESKMRKVIRLEPISDCQHQDTSDGKCPICEMYLCTYTCQVLFPFTSVLVALVWTVP